MRRTGAQKMAKTHDAWSDPVRILASADLARAITHGICSLPNGRRNKPNDSLRDHIGRIYARVFGEL